VPLLMCPNCQAGMQSLTRSGVEFDMCSSCRGVWLDRGELEKIVENARGDTVANDDTLNRRRQPQPEQEQEYGERGERGEYGERAEHGERGHEARGRRNRGLGIFDIFD